MNDIDNNHKTSELKDMSINENNAEFSIVDND